MRLARMGITRRGATGVAVLALLGACTLSASPASGTSRAVRGDGDMMMVGNMDEYPDLQRAGPRNVARARRLLHASLRTASRFDTVARAEAQGYRFGSHPRIRPGFNHMRKDGTRFWGRVFDPEAPQSLVFWCPSHGACKLAVYMYRAPGGKPPSTWHDLLQWHRHGMHMSASWMMHLWLVKHTREAFATCAPMDALVQSLHIRKEPYRADIDVDQPCKPEPAMP